MILGLADCVLAPPHWRGRPEPDRRHGGLASKYWIPGLGRAAAHARSVRTLQARRGHVLRGTAPVPVDPATEPANACGHAELIPLEDPYTVKRGGILRVRCLINGQATAGLTVLAGGVTPRRASMPETRRLGNADGVAEVRLSSPGRWYINFIRNAAAHTAGNYPKG